MKNTFEQYISGQKRVQYDNKFLLHATNIKKCGRVGDETTIHKRQNDTEINNFKLPIRPSTVSNFYKALSFSVNIISLTLN